MGKKRKTKRGHHQVKTKPHDSQHGAGKSRQREKPVGRQPFGGKINVVFAILPALIVVLAVLWDWAMRLSEEGWNENPDISTFMFIGQRLAEGSLTWTRYFEDKLLINQFLFYIPAMFNSYKVWYLMSMGACLAGAYSVYVIVRDIFSHARGFSPQVGRYAGLYGGAFTLYLFSTTAFEPHHINSLSVSMSLAGAVLTKRYMARSEANRKTAVLLAACFCASVAVGLRPYLLFFVGLIPLWISIAAQLDGENGKIDYRSTVKFAFVWNACAVLFLLCVNFLPYVIIGEFDSIIAGIDIMREKVFPGDVMLWLTVAYNNMEVFSTLLFFSWAVFVVFFLTRLVNTFYDRATAFELLALTIVAPFSIFLTILARHFWPHYIQFVVPFIGIGAVSLFVLLDGKRLFRFLFRYKAIAVIPALLFVSPPVTDLQTKPRWSYMVPTVQNLSALLDKHGLEKGDFLAPYNDYVHVKLNQHKHGFPTVAVSVTITIKGLTREAKYPPKFRMPTTSREYCQMLDSRGPKLVVFFKDTTFIGYGTPPGHLVHCNLRNYDRYDLRDKARLPSDVMYYFIRK